MLKKITFKPGVNRENTRYTNEGGWYETDKVRFRQGTPEKIGGWVRISTSYFIGICRSLYQWATNGGSKLTGVGTNKKFYIESGGTYYDVTPVYSNPTLNNPFTATNGLSTILVTDTAHGMTDGSYVTFSGAVGLGGNVTAGVLNQEYVITYVTSDSYTITVSVTANGSDTGNGGAAVVASYQVPVGPEIAVPVAGWGAGAWGLGPWGVGVPSDDPLRVWSQASFGEDLVFGPNGGGLYYWSVAGGLTARGVKVTDMVGASDVPTIQNLILVSDVSRFVLVFGCNELGGVEQDPMLIRWSDQESVTMWTPAPTNQAGDIRLSRGSKIVAVLQTRQEVLVWTDSAVYSLQYVGYPAIWKTELLADNISIMSQNAPAVAGGVVYWMGQDKFYKYDGHVTTMKCDLRQYIYANINMLQAGQVFGSTNEGFNEVWWFYCTGTDTTVGNYVVYNYEENVWYYGTMARTAWVDSGVSSNPLAATYSNNIVSHENGLDDNTDGTALPIEAYILSSEFDIDDGHNFGFVWRMLPDITFQNSSATSPQVTMTLYPLQNSGSGYTDPASVAGSNYASVTRTSTVTVEQFTGQINVRVRGRQMAFKVASDQLGCTWQLGSPRIDIRNDGRKA